MHSPCKDCYLRGPGSCCYPKRLGPGAVSCVNVRRIITGPPSVYSMIPMSSPDLKELLFLGLL